MPRKIAIIFAAVLLLTLLLFLIGWRMKIRRIENYLTGKYKEKFGFRYSFSEYLGNFRSQYLQIHWGDEPILDRCIRIVQDKTSGTYTELGCFFVSGEEYGRLKANQARSPEFLYNYLWPAYKERGFPAFYIYSALPEDVLLKRKQRAVEACKEYSRQ